MKRKHINQKDNKIKYCRECGVILTEDNWAIGRQENSSYICKNCESTSGKQRARKSIVGSKNGKVLRGVKKTIRPNNCELCGRDCDEEEERLNYHHWDDNFLQMGIWLCGKCHNFAEMFDKDYPNKYMDLKTKLMLKFIDKHITK